MAEGVGRDASGPAGFVAPGVLLAPAPDWADQPPLDIPAEADPRFVVAGVSILLEDVQTNLAGAEPLRFWRRAEMVVAATGANHAARFQLEFDPTCERVEIHCIRIHRAGQILERGAANEFEVLRRERNLEMRQFDGRLTVHLEIPDVRVGDVVETACSISGRREILADRHDDLTQFEWSPTGMVDQRRRLLAPASRTIAFKAVAGEAPPMTETQAGDLIDRRWRVHGREGVATEPLAPPWVMQLATFQMSEWRDWAEVAARFVAVYEDAGPLPAALEEQIAEFSVLATPEERAAAALRFVQHSIRYLAISMGAGGLVPRSLEDIWNTRYGDCKDVTKLYVHIARRLGLDACPALVDVGQGENVKSLLPSPIAFNHCLIRVRIDKATYWLDATMSAQPSPLATLVQPRFGWALPLAAETAALEHMGEDPYLTLCDSNERVELPDRRSKPIIYEWIVTSRGWRAEWLRAEIAHQGETGYFREQEARIKSVWHGAKLVENGVADDVSKNEIQVTQKFELTDAWRDAEEDYCTFTTLDTVITGALASLPDGPVKHPIYLGRVGRIARKVEIQAARAEGADGWERMIVDDAASVNFTYRKFSASKYQLDEELKIRKTTMHRDGADRYRELANELRATDVMFRARARKDKFGKAKEGFDWSWVWWLWIAFVVVNALLRVFS